jgi:hypothetical protein
LKNKNVLSVACANVGLRLLARAIGPKTTLKIAVLAPIPSAKGGWRWE